MDKEKRTKKRDGNLLYLVVGICTACIMIVALFEKYVDKQDTNTDISEMQPGKINTSYGLLLESEEQGEKVIINSVFGQIEYPSAFSDIVVIEPKQEQDKDILEFYSKMENGIYLIYTLTFSEEKDNELCRNLYKRGKEVYVHVEISEIPVEMAEAEINTFYAAQDTINDVLLSLFE